MMNKSKIINFPNQSVFGEFLDTLRDAHKEGRLNNFICIYDCEYREGERREGFRGIIGKYWFGEKSCIYLLGLVEIMRDIIITFIKESDNEGTT